VYVSKKLFTNKKGAALPPGPKGPGFRAVKRMKCALILPLLFASFLYPQLVEESPIEQIAESEELVVLAPSFEPLDLQLPAPQFEIPHKKEWLAITLSSLFPGLGHMYLGDMKTGTSLAGSAVASLGIATLPNGNKSVRIGSVLAFQTASFYGMYAAYRDVRLFNGLSQYKYKMPMDSFADLSVAPFRWKVMKKTEVWGGILGSLALAMGGIYCHHQFGPGHKAHIRSHCSTFSEKNLTPVLALPIGISEESFFRGFLQSTLCESFSPTTGIILSSLVFGAAHIPNAMVMDPEDRWSYYSFSLPVITLLGGYAGWLTNKNHSLQESVAIHTWYDAILFSIDLMAKQSASTGKPGFAVAIPF
jgi:membrane protease YdiL (CAAX protease family)